MLFKATVGGCRHIAKKGKAKDSGHVLHISRGCQQPLYLASVYTLYSRLVIVGKGVCYSNT